VAAAPAGGAVNKSGQQGKAECENGATDEDGFRAAPEIIAPEPAVVADLHCRYRLSGRPDRGNVGPANIGSPK